MRDITISPAGQGVILLSIVGGVGALVAAQIPELQRYIKIRSM